MLTGKFAPLGTDQVQRSLRSGLRGEGVIWRADGHCCDPRRGWEALKWFLWSGAGTAASRTLLEGPRVLLLVRVVLLTARKEGVQAWEFGWLF